jgi:cysteine desulfurase family protein (TIGR01976 family)
MNEFDNHRVEMCRRQFPGLARQQNGRPMVFFDGPAGTQVPRQVIEAIGDYLATKNANAGGEFATSQDTDTLIAEASGALADFLGADDPAEIVFGQNMTSLTFALSRALARTWEPGDEVIVTALDHDANYTPWVLAAEERGVIVRVVDFSRQDGRLNLDEYARLLSPRTKLAAIGCASNATGGINPVRRMTQMAHAVGARVFLDAVHYAPHGLIDVRHWNCDFLACSTYKFFGPHLGVLWGRRAELETLTPYKVRPSSDELPWRWMTGTQSHEAIAGALACVDYFSDLGRDLEGNRALSRRDALEAAMKAIGVFESKLAWRLLDGLKKTPGVKVYGITDPALANERFSTVSFTHRDWPTSQLARELARRGICVWGGNYYALEFSRRMGLEPEGMIRVGLVHYNTPAEVERFLTELAAIVQTPAVKGDR